MSPSFFMFSRILYIIYEYYTYMYEGAWPVILLSQKSFAVRGC